MKIWYQSLFDVGRIPAYFDGVRKRLATVARPGTEVHLHAMPEGVYGTRAREGAVLPHPVSNRSPPSEASITSGTPPARRR